MKAQISPNEYYSFDIFEREKDNIFLKIWNFVGTINDFKNVNDFVATRIGDIPVVIQNLKGEIKSYKNICSHRHSIIQVENKGNRPLMCPYHGWAYNEKGIPNGIPKKPLFNFTTEELECLKLKEYKVAICGSLVFVNLDSSSASLKDFLGDHTFSEIENISNNFGDLVDVNIIKIAANWKILVENTLESYHVNLIHSSTFMKLGAYGFNFEFENSNSVWNASLGSLENEGKQKRIHQSFQDRDYVIEGYKHLLLFPNVLISTTYGVSFNLSIINPIDSENSLFTSLVFITKKNSEINVESILENMYVKSLIEFNRKVFEEDKDICEKVQLGVKFSEYTGELSEEEKRVYEFQKSYRKYMSGSVNKQE